MAAAMEEIAPSIVEEGVSEEAQTMARDKVFWSHFTPNLVPAGWVIGVLLAAIGLDLKTGLAAMVIGNILGALPVAFAALIGPVTGLTQMEGTRFSFGRAGTRLPAFINWISCIGWDAVNNVPSAVAFCAFFAWTLHLKIPFWLSLSLLVVAQLSISIYGHHVVQATEKYLGYFLLAVFAFIGILSVKATGLSFAVSKAVSPATLVLGISMVASFNLAWAAYSSDYTRYLPRSTPRSAVFWRTFLGMFLSAMLVEFFGLATAGAIATPTPGAVIDALVRLSGVFAPLALLALAVSSVAVNSLNDNTGAYSLISAGIHIPRPVSAAIAAGAAFCISLYGQGQFAALYERYLLLILYWIAPWIAIVLVHGWVCGYGRRDYAAGWAKGASLFVAVTAITIFLFASTEVYTGPVAKALGGMDIGYFAGFLLAGSLYALLAGKKTRTMELLPLREEPSPPSWRASRKP